APAVGSGVGRPAPACGDIRRPGQTSGSRPKRSRQRALNAPWALAGQRQALDASATETRSRERQPRASPATRAPARLVLASSAGTGTRRDGMTDKRSEERPIGDVSLIDEMLRMTPEERLRQNDRRVRTVQEVREGFPGHPA